VPVSLLVVPSEWRTPILVPDRICGRGAYCVWYYVFCVQQEEQQQSITPCTRCRPTLDAQCAAEAGPGTEPAGPPASHQRSKKQNKTGVRRECLAPGRRGPRYSLLALVAGRRRAAKLSQAPSAKRQAGSTTKTGSGQPAAAARSPLPAVSARPVAPST
jgi:hypothetical protein